MNYNIKIRKAPGVGNIVSKSNVKVKRLFKINRQKFKVYSKILNTMIYLKIDTKLFRTINKYLSIDRFILFYKPLPIEFYKIRKNILNILHTKNKNI